MNLRGATAGMSPWTAADKAVLREKYLSDGAAEVARLTGRSKRSVFIQAHRLGIGSTKAMRWSAADEEAIRSQWGEVPIAMIAMKLKRTGAAVCTRAELMGLPMGAPEGWEYLTAAAKRTGYYIQTIRLMVAWARERDLVETNAPTIKVSLCTPPRQNRKWRRHIVEIDALNVAIEAWERSETTEAAARRVGLSAETVRNALVRAGYAHERPGKGRQWRVLPEEVDEALKDRGARESLKAAAKRYGLTREQLAARLLASVLPGCGSRPWRVLRADVDRLMSMPKSTATARARSAA